MTKVLVVDDKPDMARLMAKTVEAQGYEVCRVHSGREALDAVSADAPDAVLLDIMMPGMDGNEVLRRLKADPRTERIPVILVTAKTDDSDIVEGLAAGAHDYVTKPFAHEALGARLRSAIQIKQDHDRLLRLNRQLRAEILERERMQQELARAQKLESIGHLAAGIAHEINTPAQYVGDNTRFLQEAFADYNDLLDRLGRVLQAAGEDRLNEGQLAELEAAVKQTDVAYLSQEVPKAIAQSLEGIERVASIVRAMKEFSHPGSGEKQAVDLNAAIQSTLTVSRNEWKYVADLATDFDRRLPPVPCYPHDLNQVILNLVVNAAHAIAEASRQGTGDRGELTVRTQLDGNWAEIRVEDTGTGIAEEARDKVFDHFFTTKEVGRGTGQGLAIAYSIVKEKHGGTIDFQTEIGKGTTFIVRLPILEPGDSDRADSGPKPAALTE